MVLEEKQETKARISDWVKIEAMAKERPQSLEDKMPRIHQLSEQKKELARGLFFEIDGIKTQIVYNYNLIKLFKEALNEHLGRRQFYRSGKLPTEISLMIEEKVASSETIYIRKILEEIIKRNKEDGTKFFWEEIRELNKENNDRLKRLVEAEKKWKSKVDRATTPIRKADWEKVKEIASKDWTSYYCSPTRQKPITDRQKELELKIWGLQDSIVSVYKDQILLKSLLVDFLNTRSLARQKQLPNEILLKIREEIFKGWNEDIIEEGIEYFWDQIMSLNYYLNKDLVKLEKQEELQAQIEMPCSWKW